MDDSNVVWKNDTDSTENATLGTIDLNIKDDNGGLMSFVEYQRVKFVLYATVVPLLCVIGSVGSSVGAGALFRSLRKEASFYNVYLFSLFTTDTLTLLYGLWTGIPAIVTTFDRKLGLYLEVKRLKYHNFLIGWLFNNSAFILLIISLQRCLALTKPHTVKDMWLTKYPSRFVLAIVVFNAVFCAPSLLIFDSKLLTDSVSNSSVVVDYRKYSILSETGFRLYVMAYAFIYQFVELTLALVFNVGIIVMIKKRTREHGRSGVKSLSAVGRRQQQMTYTTLVILSLFVLLQIPSVVGSVIAHFVNDKEMDIPGEQNFNFKVWFDIYGVLSYLNCSLDVLIYVLLNSRLRKELFQHFCCIRKERTQPENCDHAGHMATITASNNTSSLE